MSTQVLNGSGNISYTNNTGKNVRLIINYMSITTTNFQQPNASVKISWGVDTLGNLGSYTIKNLNVIFGKNIATSHSQLSLKVNYYNPPYSRSDTTFDEISFAPGPKNMAVTAFTGPYSGAYRTVGPPARPFGVPMEYMLAPGHIFKVESFNIGQVGKYNILLITEN